MLLQVLDSTLRKLKAQTANICTMVNLSLGCAALLFTLQDEFKLALIFIFLAALSDRFDGMLARKLGIESELGRQLDSLCDLVSFGVAPALLIYQTVLYDYSVPGAFFTILYIACGAFRLARFNVTESNGYFQGVPITVAGCLLTLSYFLAGTVSTNVFLVLLIALSFLMVSSVKLKKM
ncbi:CDP-diacylglycerol--serine O-phosphatidyltransferase [Ectobacillus ponti]|uniref:CDP-diacylglycerol--serine O-phosphatidyltransferase n=1 Tax=Ectobacillus ponti TaxID=2961894 RepID=A0AA41X242_9BACI|nr:CDP-diacylglycerol--serine O-phosphatidyltransferase [Ectobacillus ponti]MCP8967202.1 CDP-diacylglycerol--serine O-phosphatidyltransferase [Ectobacillus ponti]